MLQSENGKSCPIGCESSINHSLSLLFDHLPDPAALIDRDGIVILFNRAFGSLAGESPEKAVGRHFAEYMPHECRDKAIERFRKLHDGPHRSDLLACRFLRPNGTVFHGELHLRFYEDGAASGMIGVISNVTERRRFQSLMSLLLRIQRMQGQLTASEVLREALELGLRETGGLLGFYVSFDRKDGVAPERVWAGELSAMVPDRYRSDGMEIMDIPGPWAEAAASLKPVLANRCPLPFSRLGIPGSFMPRGPVLAIPVVDAGSLEGLLAICGGPYDLDEEDLRWTGSLVDAVWGVVARKRAEQAERNVQSVLMEIQKMDLVGQLAGGIAHDFNNMLGIIIGNAEMSMEGMLPDIALQKSFSDILKASRRAATLTSQLLAFARRQTAIPQLVPIDDAVTAIVPSLKRLVDDTIRFAWFPQAGQATVSIDPIQVEQVLTNLCLNARDAIGHGGEIVVRSGIVTVERFSFEQVGYRVPGRYASISVSDNGCGIEKSSRSHLFEPFFTTKHHRAGAGLGLSTVYGIVKQNNGFIDFESYPGRGSVFMVCLPLQGEPSSDISLFAEEGSERLQTVLLVEDEPDILNLCRMILEQAGYRVLAAVNPNDALCKGEDQSCRIDLLLTDVIMPGMTGCELSARLVSLRPGMKTLYMSGYTPSAIGRDEVHDGVNFIQKPFSIDALLSIVGSMLRKDCQLDLWMDP